MILIFSISFFYSIAFLTNAKKKWLLANQSAGNRLPSTAQSNKQAESSESDESNESDESHEFSQEISSPAKAPTLGNIDHIDKKFMLQHCKGYANQYQFGQYYSRELKFAK